MKPKAIVKIAVDVLMSVGMLLLMGYQFFGDALHEWIGAGAFLLFILHHILNAGFYKNLFRGRYTPLRVWGVVVDVLVFAAMAGLMISGVMMSVHVFRFLGIKGGMAFARTLHVAATHWGFALMALHLGLHWGMVVNMFKKATKIQKPSKVRAVFCFVIASAIAVYGVYVFISRDFPDYMFLKTHFVFLDYEESPVIFYADYLAMAGAFVWAGHYSSKLLKKLSRDKARDSGKQID